jgi:hypothetical protein
LENFGNADGRVHIDQTFTRVRCDVLGVRLLVLLSFSIDFSEIGLTPRRSKKTEESFGEATNGMPVVVLQRKIRFVSTKNPDSLQACPRVGSYR